jgi:hypothetical protein
MLPLVPFVLIKIVLGAAAGALLLPFFCFSLRFLAPAATSFL